MGVFIIVFIVLFLYIFYVITNLERMVKKQREDIEEVKSLLKINIKENQK
ncbi:hypothetical protein SAMN05192559_101870 [Halobacillus karajensis]|uniref:Uncharacterized protein n=1 Tax=Halobacillus karajensis TaxID=195088 RepID=A0A059NXA6_9BACI|nr:FeoB-associated Cys-rich membrane protein [Halobacillus karajensis]CDQ18518.1 hypothetical protein BN982_00791 [Halobacillus karajensis]CDQ23410.1 hypothetical protein BN983_01637 [Halobacillus karajensis]CDQ26892.1 hypothetical protein BN981_01117 [Halobacillus karajensis]SEH50470.1 hypothetical protein SAMN05192559_101870 [Halobacillus karajensis]